MALSGNWRQHLANQDRAATGVTTLPMQERMQLDMRGSPDENDRTMAFVDILEAISRSKKGRPPDSMDANSCVQAHELPKATTKPHSGFTQQARPNSVQSSRRPVTPESLFNEDRFVFPSSVSRPFEERIGFLHPKQWKCTWDRERCFSPERTWPASGLCESEFYDSRRADLPAWKPAHRTFLGHKSAFPPPARGVRRSARGRPHSARAQGLSHLETSVHRSSHSARSGRPSRPGSRLSQVQADMYRPPSAPP